MKISSLIELLQQIEKEHGDLRCVTPGFDESEYDDIATVKVITNIIFRDDKSKGHSGQHEIVWASDNSDTDKAVFINF